MTKPPTYEELTALNLGLRRQLIASQEARREDEALVTTTIDLKAKAHALSNAYHKRPWASAEVYAAGRELIKAVRGGD